MKKEAYKGELEQERKEGASWRLLALVMAGANLLLVLWLMGLDMTPRTHIVPPGAQRAYWIEKDGADQVLYEEMTRSLASLLLTANPRSIASNVEALLRYVRPEAHDTLRQMFDAHVKYLQKHGYSTVFYPQEFQFRKNQVAVIGQYNVFVGSHASPGTTKAYLFTYKWDGGSLWLEAFRETDPRDPFREPDPDPVEESVQ